MRKQLHVPYYTSPTLSLSIVQYLFQAATIDLMAIIKNYKVIKVIKN